MRLPQENIKQALLHPDVDVRDVALQYCSDAPGDDHTIMPLAIRAIEQYGRLTAFSWTHYFNGLPQTEQTIDWVIAELQRDLAGPPELVYFYRRSLSRVPLQADIRLVARRAPEIIQATHFQPRERPAFDERLQMFAWDAATCWQALHGYCDANRDKNNIEEFDLGHGQRIAEALARQPHEYAAQVVAAIAEPVHAEHLDGRRWLQPLLMYLAGQMRLEAAIAPLVGKLGHANSFLSDQALFALARIGSEAVVAAIAERWPGASRDFRLYAGELLGKIHRDSTVEAVFRFLPGEPHPGIRLRLCEALLDHFSFEGIEPTRQFIAQQTLTPDVRRLRANLIAVCKLTGWRFPAFDAWQQEARNDTEQESAQMREIQKWTFEAGGDLGRLVDRMYAEIAAKQSEKQRLEARIAALEGRLAPVRAQRPVARPMPPSRIGRNDPCPCGSGKKFKHCCMRAQR